jgi:hypothetical protein
MSRAKCAVGLLALAGGLALLVSICGAQQRSASPAVAVPSRLSTSILSSLPLTFEPNNGLADPLVQFSGRGHRLSVFLTEREIAVAFPGRARAGSAGIEPRVGIRLVRAARSKRRRSSGRLSHPRGSRRRPSRRKRSGRRRGTAVRGRDVSSRFAWRGEGLLPGRSNYFIGNDARAWRTNVPHYSQADAEGALPGVGVKIYGNELGVEYDLRLAAGVDAAGLRLKFSGASGVQLAANGDLVMRAGVNELRMKKPSIYEESSGGSGREKGKGPRFAETRGHVDGGYVLETDGSVGFWVGAHDPSAELVIDPSLSVTYASFLGGSGNEAASSIALDSAGNVYIGGTTNAPGSFSEPSTATVGPGIGSGSSANTEYFVAKINPNASGGSSLVYLTFIGGSSSQAGGLIGVDGSGDIAITGTTTSPDFPVTDGSTLTSGSNDATVSEIDPTGSTLIFSTIFGGSGTESQYGPGGIAIDAQGRIYIASDTNSQDLLVTAGVFQAAFAGTSSDGFVAIFQPGASPDLAYCSYLGTNASAQVGVGGVAMDASGNAYIAGFSSNAQNGFPTKNAFQTAYGGGSSDAFLMKIFPGGQGAADVIYATLLGGSGLDEALAVAVDDSIPANAYVTGTTQSKNFPTNGANAPYQSSLHVNATANAFLSVIAQNPSTGMATLAYSTYIGGSANDAGLGVTAAAFNSVYITGAAKSWDFPWHDNLQPFNGSSDGFVAKFDPSAAGAASSLYATPLGGTAPPGVTVTAAASAIAADAFGDVYVAGQTTAADFPTALTTGGAMNGFQPICASCQNYPATADAFLVALQESAASQPSLYFNVGSVVFPAQPAGTQNAPQPVAVHNGGETSLAITSLQITGPNSSDFSLIGPAACKTQAIPTGGECSFEVGFVPSTTGPEEAVVSFTDNAPGSPQVLELVGAGQSAFALLSTTSIDFGTVPENTVSLSLPITITNTGNQALTMQSPVESGPDVAQFFLNGKDITCGTTLAAGASCSIGVVFSPKAIGTFHAQVTITDNSGGVTNATQVVSLTGTATTVAPVISVTPSAIAFGDVVVGTSSGAQQVTITSSGSAALNLTGVTLSGANAPDFAMAGSGTNQCPTGSASLAIGASCVVSVRFAPLAGDSAGLKSATLSVMDNAAGSPQVISLTGSATVPPSIQISPSSLNFPAQSVGIASAPQSVTVLNGSAASLSVSGVSVSGANASDFSETNNCPPSLRAAASCTLSVVFTPTPFSASTRTAAISVADNAPNSPQTIALTGSVTQAGISITPSSINFGGQLAGTSGQPQTITVTNTGTGALSVSSIAVTGAVDFKVGANTCKGANVPAGGTCTVQVTFGPACTNGSAARSATLVLTDNLTGSPQSVALSGSATGDFCFDPSTTVSVAAGQTAVYSMVVDSPTAYKGSVSLTCAGAPATTTCTIPASVTVPSQFTVSVATVASSVEAPLRRRNRGIPGPIAWMIAVVALVLWGFSVAFGGVKPNSASALWGKYAAAGLVLVAFSFWMAGCGGGGSGGDPASVAGTPTGSYSLTLTGMSPNTTSQVTLTLTVN